MHRIGPETHSAPSKDDRTLPAKPDHPNAVRRTPIVFAGIEIVFVRNRGVIADVRRWSLPLILHEREQVRRRTVGHGAIKTFAML